jgi:tetratricopeptide (TPR) repeat protein
MAKKKTEKTVKHEAQKTVIPEGIELARVRDMANDFNIHHIRYAIGKNITGTVKRPHFAIFLGAGASKDSHIKLAWEMMEDFKKIILADEGLTFDTDKEKDDWFEAQEWFKQSDNKYSCLFCRAYKTDIDRRNYIQDVIAEGEASLGYIILSNFIAEGYVETIITTNFDDLVYQACTSYTAVRPVVYSLGGFASEMSSMIDRPKVIKIHGDFLFSRLKNTEDQLREQDPNMSDQVEEILRKYEGLIVIGYRGSDDSVMRLLQKLPDGHSLYWCEVSRLIDGKPTIELNQNVIELLKAKNGKLVEITSFDRLMKELLEIVNFDENIIVKAFEKRQDKLNEELHKFDMVPPDGNNQPPGETEKKEETFSAKIENVFDNISLRNKAYEAWRAKKYDEQEKIARRMIENNPDDYSGYFNLALAQQSIVKDSDEAEENYRKAIKLNPNYAETYNNLGNLLAQDETQRKEAEENYREAIKLNPLYVNAYFNLGNLLAKDETRRDEAEENYRKAIKLNPNDAEAYYNLACLYSIRKNRNEALNYLKKAAEMDSEYKSMAKAESDFDSIRNYERFREIVGRDE